MRAENGVIVRNNFKRIREEVKALNKNCQIVAVTKGRDVDDVKLVIEAGALIVAENRVAEAEAEAKFGVIATPQKHMIGHLQRNKVKKAVMIFDVIQSVDSFRLASEINRRCAEIGKKMPICLQVNTANDPEKYGLSVDEVEEVAADIGKLGNVEIVGLMTIGKLEATEDEQRKCFLKLKNIYDEFVTRGIFASNSPILSMGMSNDYKIAIECGSNMVRIGSEIFAN